MHDDPRLYPHLPSKPLDPGDDDMLAPVQGTIWQTCWEYVLTHELTDTERSAFWHGASLVHAAMTETGWPEAPAMGFRQQYPKKRAHNDFTDCNDRCYGEPCVHRETS